MIATFKWLTFKITKFRFTQLSEGFLRCPSVSYCMANPPKIDISFSGYQRFILDHREHFIFLKLIFHFLVVQRFILDRRERFIF